MSLHKETEKQLQKVYESRKPYLNRQDCCEELHDMCMTCDKFCGIKRHDYEECKEKSCFRNWLGLEYLDWVNSYFGLNGY